MPESFTVPHSMSRHSCYEIRYGKPGERESNQQHLARLGATYGLTPVQVKLLVELPNVDLFGREVARP